MNPCYGVRCSTVRERFREHPGRRPLWMGLSRRLDDAIRASVLYCAAVVLRSLRLLSLSSFLSVSLLAGGASAFERQWRFGGGAGVLVPGKPYSLAPAVGAYGAYGVSDAFDVKLELSLARSTADPDLASFFYGAHGALAYKLDVIQWIPYFGIRGGAVGVSDPIAPFESLSPSAGGIAGVDYAFSRDLGFGLQLSLDFPLASSGTRLFGALITAEYHFGY